jgi:hypothetical protein
MKVVSDLRLLLTGLWLGAAAFFIVVAQTVFSVLPTRELAGAVVNRTLAVVNISGLVIGLLLLLISFATTRNTNIFLLWSERFLLFVLAAACGASQFVIGWWLLSLRTQMGRPVDEVPLEDPLRIQFNTLHQYSEWLLLAAMIAAFLGFLVIANRRFGANKDKAPLDINFPDQFKI